MTISVAASSSMLPLMDGNSARWFLAHRAYRESHSRSPQRSYGTPLAVPLMVSHGLIQRHQAFLLDTPARYATALQGCAVMSAFTQLR